MRRCWPLFACLCAGCSTHPVVDALDYFAPGRLGPNEVQPYGGVCLPQGPVQPPAQPPVIVPDGAAPVPGPPAPGAPGVVVPPPLPGGPAVIQTPIPVPTGPPGSVPPPPTFPQPGM